MIEHPAVEQVAVVGVPHPTWGQSVHAIVVVAPSSTADIGDDLMAFARERIAGYKVPKTIETRADPLPLSGAGKVQKHRLRADANAQRSAAENED